MKGPGGPGGAPKKPKVLVEKQIRKKETPQKNDLPTPASAAKWVNPYTFTAGPQEEKHLEVPPGLEKKTSDPYAEWSDAERMAEYTETGNPQYLTPKLALDMDVGQEIMRQVPGATDAHIFASKSEEDFRAEEKEYTNQILTKYAADSKSLDGLPFGEQVQRMLAVAGLRVTGGGLELHELESARNTAMDMLRTMLVEREDGVHELFGALRYADSAGQRDLWVVESLYKMTHDDFVLLSHTPADELTDAERERGRGCARALNEFVEVGRAFIGGEFAPETKYLFAERARALACEIGGLSEQTDFEKQEPFEITKGRYAVFTHDGNRIYIADQETTKDVVDLLRNAPPVWREETGQYFARFHREHVPQEVWEAVDMVMDAGIPLDRVVGEFGMQDKELIHDYVAMLQSPSRKVIENDFNVVLSTLTLREQFYFLEYLKNVTVAYSENVKEFCRTFGVDGLRTFLASSYNPELADQVIVFANLTEEAVVKDVFRNYAALLDGAQTVSHVVREGVGSDPSLQVLPDQLFDAYVRRSADLFFAAERMALSWYEEETRSPETVADLQEAFRGLSLLTNVLADMYTQQTYSVQRIERKDAPQNVFFDITDKRTGSKYQLKTFVRPTGVDVRRSDGSVRKEQARVNFELSLDQLPNDDPLRAAFTSRTKFADKKKAQTSSVVRMGFDLDDAFDPPRLSFDMGRNAYTDEHIERSGDVLGNILGRVGADGHHLYDSFDQKLSDPAVFAQLANELRRAFQEVAPSRPE